MPLKKGVKASVADLLTSSTFLESLSPKERSELLTAARNSDLAASPDPSQRDAVQINWGSGGQRHEQHQVLEDDLSMHLLQYPDTAIAAVQQACDALEVLQRQQPVVQLMVTKEGEQLKKRKQLLQRQKSQLQAKITSLQYQVSMLLANSKAADYEGNQRLAALKTVITHLQATMADVGATAARVAKENKALTAENRQLTAEQKRHFEMMQQLQAHCRELEVELLTRVSAAGQQAAEAAAEAASPLNALLTPAVLAATAPPPGANPSCGSSLSHGSSKVVPALQEVAALKRVRDLLQKQVAQLQQQLSAAENQAQTAAQTAATERARSNKSLAKAQQQLAAAVQRLRHVADREQQQLVVLQARDKYIAKLEQCLLDQHQQLVDVATATAGAASGKSPPRSHSASGCKVAGVMASTLGLRNSLGPFSGVAQIKVDHRQSQQQQRRAVSAGTPGHTAGSSGTSSNHGREACRVNTGVSAIGSRAAPAFAATSEIPLQHGRCSGHVRNLRTGSSAAAAAALTSPVEAVVLASPDVNVAKRSAIARQCMSMMLSGSPEGRLARRAAALVEQSSSGAAAETARSPKAAAASQPGRLPGGLKSGHQQQQSCGLQQLQQSRLQQWQQRQLKAWQQVPGATAASDAGVVCQGHSEPTVSGVGGTRTSGRQQQQQRQQRLRQLLQQQQQRTRSQQVRLPTARRQQQQGGPWQQPQQQTQQQQRAVGEECHEEAQAGWQQLQRQVLQTQAHTATAQAAGGGSHEGHDPVQAAAAPGPAASNAPRGHQHGEKQQVLDSIDGGVNSSRWSGCSDEDLNTHQLALESAGQQQHGVLGQSLGTAVNYNGKLITEEQLEEQVLEMQHNMQLLQGQLLQLGCA